jgi:sterol 14-demethylase
MGEQFAYMQIKTIWSVLLRNFELELVSPLPKPDFEAMVVGPKGEFSWVTLRAHWAALLSR